MKLEAVITCVDYADFLAHTLPTNRALFDRLIVVTTTEDLDTQRVCDHAYVECVTTSAFRAQDGEFHKGAGINVGLEHLTLDGWVVHLDADIVLPAHAREILDNAPLDPRMVYGIDRYNLRSAAQWDQHLRRPPIQQELGRCLVHLSNYPLGARVSVPHLQGWAPIGFFQLWNPSVSGVKRYPENHVGADRTDMMFACQWPRARRGLLPEIVAYHLESEHAAQGANWQGRTTRPFTTTNPHRSRKPGTGRRRLRAYGPHAAATGLGAGVSCLAPWPLTAGYWAVFLLLWTLLTAARCVKRPRGYA